MLTLTKKKLNSWCTKYLMEEKNVFYILLNVKNNKCYSVKAVYVFIFACSGLHNLKNMPAHKCMFQVSDVDVCLIFGKSAKDLSNAAKSQVIIR